MYIYWTRKGKFEVELLHEMPQGLILHRIDGPAIIYPDGAEEWFVDGVRHRDDGPGGIYPNNYYDWYYKGKHYSFDGYLEVNDKVDKVLFKLIWG